MADESLLGLPFFTAILILFSLSITWYRNRDPLLNVIPTIGYSDPFFSYFSAFRYTFIDAFPMVKLGYEKHKPGLFKIATFRRWTVLPTSAELIQDVKIAPSDVLSSSEPRRELTQMDYTLGVLHNEANYQIDVIRFRLTRNIGIIFDEINDEIVNALEECIPATNDEWVKTSIVSSVQNMIGRVSSRIFVGAPLCRNREYLEIVINFAINVMKIASILAMFPKPLKPIVAYFFPQVPTQVRRTVEFIKPMVEERFAKMEEHGGTWDDAPNDLLMWLMNEAKGVERSPERLARQLLGVYFASIHTSSLSFTHVFYRLLSHPEYIEPLRQEVEAAVAEQGWTKAGIDEMHKLDSFIREALRVDSIVSVAMTRLTLRPFTFSNGVTIPANTLVSLPRSAIHTDEEIYTNAEEFDGFRFLSHRSSEGDATVTTHKAVTTSYEHFAFGLGRHACPGRFFAIIVIKALLARIIATYDVKFDEEGKGIPRQRRIGPMCIPRNVNVLFRKRQKQDVQVIDGRSK